MPPWTCENHVVLEKVNYLDKIKSEAPHGIEQNGQPQPAAAYREHAERFRPDLIRCWWTHDTPLTPRTSRILPDNASDLIVRSDGAAWFVGPATRADLFQSLGNATLRAIRINPAALGVVSGIDAAELADNRIDFDDIFPRQIAQKLATAIWWGNQRLVLEIFADAQPISHIVEGYRLLEKRPDVEVNQIARRIGQSPRNFRRMIKLQTGLSPKLIQRVSRFRSFVDSAEHTLGAINLALLSSAHGYADQAHLTRESSALSGLPPLALLAERASA